MFGRAVYRCYHTSATIWNRRSLLAGKTIKFEPKPSKVDQSPFSANVNGSSITSIKQTVSVESKVVQAPRRVLKPAPVDPDYTDYLSNIVDDSQYREEELKRVPVDPEDRRAALLAKRQQQAELAAHNAMVVPTGESRRVRKWMARNKRRRTRADRNRNKQAFRRAYDEADQADREREDLWENMSQPDDGMDDALNPDDDLEPDDVKEHRLRRQRVSRKEKAVQARTHLTAVKQRKRRSDRENEYV